VLVPLARARIVPEFPATFQPSY